MTQKYIPVEWTDETPTQPGTLINKARLDQMQSAHHFADGFEEVDAIPTEDPGTDYHKVVYCTADTTFYRWDGAEWTADIDDDTKRLLLEHEADHANPHQVTKAQVGLGNADNTSDADKPISTATAAALAGKVDKLGSSPAGSYTKVTVNAQGQVTAGSNPATLAEAGITDAYTKAQVDTKLGDGSVTKLGTADVGSDTTPIKLVGGSPTPVADALAKDGTVVHLNGAETIPGAKTFSGGITAYQYDYGRGIELKRGNLDVTSGIVRAATYIEWTDKNNATVLQLTPVTQSDKGTHLDIAMRKADGTTKTFSLINRAYNAANVDDIATIATLDAYTPMVRTTGAQTIAGDKTFTGQMLATGQRAYNTANETDVVTIGSLKASTDVVHMTGDEVLSNGVKANTTAGSSSAGNTKDVPPRFVVQSTGFDRTALQGINRHYPVAGLNDKNGKPVAKLNISTTDTIITTYLQGVGIDETQATLELAKFDRATHTWEPTMANNALDNYASMLRTTGNQTKTGILTLTNQPVLALGGSAARLPALTDYLHFGTIQSSADTNYTVPVIIFERGGLVIGDIAVAVSGGAVTTVIFSGKTIVGSTTRIFVGATMSSDGIELYCHSDSVNRYFVANILGAMSGSGYGQRVMPVMEIVSSAPTGYVEAAFTEA